MPGFKLNSHFSRVVFSAAIDLPKATASDDAVDAEVTECDLLGHYQLHVFPLTIPDVRVAGGVCGKCERGSEGHRMGAE